MNDPLAPVLWYLLGTKAVVHRDEICWWDPERAEAILEAAGMTHLGGSMWRTGPKTEAFAREVERHIGYQPALEKIL